MNRRLSLPSALALVLVLTTAVIYPVAARTVAPPDTISGQSASAAVPAPGVSATPAPTGLDAPERLVHGQQPGAYYLDYGGTVLDPSQYPVRGALRFFGWSGLQGAPGSYNWSSLDYWIATRQSMGLSTGVFVSTYDGKLDGDIRSTPDFVIQTPGAMIVMPETYLSPSGAPQTGFVDYYKYQNGDFQTSTHQYAWTPLGDATVVDASALGGTWAGRLGGADNSTGSLTKFTQRVPAMPPDATGVRLQVQFDSYVQTADTTPNADHLYVELVDSSGGLLASLADITNSSGTNGAWVTDQSINLNAWVGRSLGIRFRSTTNGSSPTTFYIDNVRLQVRLIIPRYWSQPYKDAYRAFVTALGDHLKDDPRVDFVSIGTGLHGETQPCNEEEKGYLQSLGLQSWGDATHPGWVQTANDITEMYVQAFSTNGVLVKNLLLQYAPFYISAYERLDMTDYAAQRGVGLSYNGLVPDWSTVYTNGGYGSYDPMIRDNHLNTVPIAWETYTYMLCSPVFTYWALFNALDKHADYLRIGDDILTGSQGAANQPSFEWAKNYWGKTPQDTPSVWVVMREHRNPTPYCHARYNPTYVDSSAGFSTWPQLGNYSFWLTQDDTIPGGQTVPETNDKGADSTYARNPLSPYQAWTSAGLGNCPTSNSYASFYPANYPCNYHPYNPDLPALVGSSATNYYDPGSWTGAGKEAWVVRRTDQATGNPYMWFVVDPQYIDGSGIYDATITVKYFDIGTDTWSLRYDSTSGEKLAGTITKTGTKQLKQAVFNVADGKFAKRLAAGRADFVIDSNRDGNEWVHMVDVARHSVQPDPNTSTPTLTPTRTPTTGASQTPSPTPSRTPTPTPSRTPSPTATTTNMPPAVNAWRAGLRPAIDGHVDEWRPLPATSLDRDNADHIDGAIPSLTDLSAGLTAAWAPEALYFSAVITDDVLIGNDSVNQWGDDVIELSLYSPAFGTHQLSLAIDGRQADNGVSISSVTFVTSTKPGGWQLEAAIPPSVFGLGTFPEGAEYRFTFALQDDDVGGGSGSQTHMFWRGTSSNTFEERWGYLRLTSSVFDFEQPASTPTATATRTPTITPSVTPTRTPTVTPSATPTPTPSTGSVAGVAYGDANHNTFQDAGEPGLVGAVLALTQSGSQRYTATSGANGAFSFTGVTPGQYALVEVAPPPSYQPWTMLLFLDVRANTALQGLAIPHELAPTNTPTATRTPTPTRTWTPTATWTPTPTSTPSRTPTPTARDMTIYLPLLIQQP